MKRKIKVLSDAGKKGVRMKKEKKEKNRHELLVILSKFVDKQMLDFIQFSQVPWKNKKLQELIDYYKYI